MTVNTGHRTGIARAVMGALLLPFLLLSLFASGTMLARSSDSVAIVICIGDTLVTRYVPADQAPPGDAPAPHADSCAWDEVLRTALPVLPAALVPAPKALAAMRFGPGRARDAARFARHRRPPEKLRHAAHRQPNHPSTSRVASTARAASSHKVLS